MPNHEESVKTEIKNVARKLIQAHGMNKTTMEDIATAMGKSRKYAYYYFRNKEEIFCEIADEEMERFLKISEATMAKEKSVAKKLEVFLITRFKEVKKTTALYPMLASDIFQFMPAIHMATKKANECFVERLETLFRQGMAEGEFKSLKQSDCRLLALAGISMLRGAEVRVVVDGSIPSPEDFCSILVKTFIKGLR